MLSAIMIITTFGGGITNFPYQSVDQCAESALMLWAEEDTGYSKYNRSVYSIKCVSKNGTVIVIEQPEK